MNEIDALKKFDNCAVENDLQGCMECLKYISVDTLNRQDEDDYRAVVNENACAIEALLQDNRCDRIHVENLCGLTAENFVIDYYDNIELQNLFTAAPELKKYIV
jgi:seryl-tRNA(Sec) selenium transferase